MEKPQRQKARQAARVLALALSGVALAACGGGGGGGGTTAAPPSASPPPPPPPSGSVQISGQITFDKVPHQSDFTGLDYDAITQEPARGVRVEAVNGSGTVLASDTTDGTGGYSVSVDPSTSVRIQVRSQMQQTSGVTWNIQVLDNTNSDAIYLLQGSLTDSGTVNSTRNLNAGSGWDPTLNSGDGGYTSDAARAAAPYAILDAIYDAVTDIAVVDPDVDFPALQVLWSPNNTDASGSIAQGEIGTSSYTRLSGVPTILILGDEDSDTDEYDSHVIVHEFGHYFEDQLSRSDSTGGAHSLVDRLDPRLAFGEGWGNAFSAMILDDPNYRDAGGAQQQLGFTFNVERDLTVVPTTTINNEGWYNEASIQQILYDVYDSVDDNSDTISAGLGPIYNAFTDPTYINNVDLTMIFAFANRLRNEPAVSGTALDALLNAEDINGTGQRGIGETNTGGVATTLPIYKTVTQGGASTTVCSTATNGTTNKHGVREFVSVTVNTTGSVTMTATKASGAAPVTDPDFRIWENGLLFTTPDRIADSSDPDSEVWTGNLDAGTYAVEVYDFNNFDGSPNPSADSCFSFSVS